MKKIAAIFVVLVLVGSVSFAQEVVPSITAGSAGILYEFSGLAYLGASSYMGGIGGKLFLSDRMAVRVALQFQYAKDNYAANPPSGYKGMDGYRSGTTFGLLAGIEYHLAKGRVSPYIGAGALFSTTSTDRKPAIYGTGTLSQPEYKNELGGYTISNINFTPGTTFGAAGIIGVEFFLYKELSLGAEYQITFGMTSYKDQEDSAPGYQTVITHPTLSSGMKLGIFNDGKLILTVYF